MKGKLLLLLLLCTVFAINSVSAAPNGTYYVDRLTATGCRFTGNSSVDCGDTVTYSCDVTDYFSNRTILDAGVKYTFRRAWGGTSVTYVANRASGSGTSGKYTVTFTVEPRQGGDFDGNDTFTVSRIEMTDSGGQTCVQIDSDPDMKGNVAGCYFVREQKVLSSQCSCGVAGISGEGSCQSNDIQPVTFNTLRPECTQYTGNTTITCDYCNPIWEGDFSRGGGCSITNGSELKGRGTIYYFHASDQNNPSWGEQCSLTSTSERFNHNGASASDRVPPPDHGMSNATCYTGTWLSRANGLAGYGNYVSPYGAPTFYRTPNVPYGSAKIQPLATDLEGDGATEVIFYDNSTMYVYSYSYVSAEDKNYFKQEKAISYAFSFVGQPAIKGLYYTPTELTPKKTTFLCSNGNVGPCANVSIVAFTVEGGGIYKYREFDKDLSVVAEINLTASPGRSGISCYHWYGSISEDNVDRHRGVCAFVTSDKKLHYIVETPTGIVDKQEVLTH